MNCCEKFNKNATCIYKERFENGILFGKIASSPNGPKMTLKATRSKVPEIVSTCARESQISLRVDLRSPIPDNGGFGFRHRVLC